MDYINEKFLIDNGFKKTPWIGYSKNINDNIVSYYSGKLIAYNVKTRYKHSANCDSIENYNNYLKQWEILGEEV